MVLPSPDPGSRPPWADVPAWRLAVLWATGPDTALDGVFRLQALRRGPDGSWERFDRFCAPFPESGTGAATARMVQEFGVTASDLEGAAAAEEAFRELAGFLRGGPVLVPDRAGFQAWWGHLAPPEGPDEAPVVLGVPDLAALLLPGRGPGRGAGRGAGQEGPRSPEDLRGELGQLVGRFLTLDAPTRLLALSGWRVAWRGLLEKEPVAADRLALALQLVERPSAWAADTGELFALHEGLRDGDLSEADPGQARAAHTAAAAAEGLRPRCAEITAEWARHETVPLEREETGPLSDVERAQLDDVFQVHLAETFGTYREGQHRVAVEVAATLAEPELLLVHAPTGTGKTLAYLVPALLWASARDVRLGISTYTRALQEQAVDLEVPRALGALRRAGFQREPRVTLLKGRANYLCWRAWRLHVPGEMDQPELWLAWVALALFARTDPDGDLDRLTPATPISGDPAHRRELIGLMRAVRAETSCCTAREDRGTCGAETARFRAERSHVVVTNHSFTLARQSFFKRVVFDECEHLHDQAHSAFSHTISIPEIRDFLDRLHRPGHPTSRAPLDRLERVVPPESSAEDALDQCLAAWLSLLGGLEKLQAAAGDFREWKREARRGRSPKDAHSLLREYVEQDVELGPTAGAEGLVEARRSLHVAGTALEAGLAALATKLDDVPARGMPRVRRALERERSALVELLEVIAAWIPIEEGQVAFREETFHDLDADARGRDVLAARVLLPNEYLGRHYYPTLQSAVLISATTWLRGGFDSARGYLGLDRAAQPAPDETRPPCRVRAFRSPDPFDYGRVLVCTPRDAPEYRDKRAFDEYVRRFVAHLAERTRGRMLVLFTNAEDARRTGQELAGFFRARRIPLWFQRMSGHTKEELGGLFRERVDSVLLGVDTFWYGADFPGETLEYLVIVKLPYGVPDPYHQAQCAVLGEGEQRRRIYMPRALAKLRQGFGRLMRRETDHGCVFVLDGRVLEPRHRSFLRELPVDTGLGGGEDVEWLPSAARLVAADTEECVHEALAHMNMLADVRRRGLDQPFEPPQGAGGAPQRPRGHRGGGRRLGGTAWRVREDSSSTRGGERPDSKGRRSGPPAGPEILDIPVQDLPF